MIARELTLAHQRLASARRPLARWRITTACASGSVGQRKATCVTHGSGGTRRSPHEPAPAAVASASLKPERSQLLAARARPSPIHPRRQQRLRGEGKAGEARKGKPRLLAFPALPVPLATEMETAARFVATARPGCGQNYYCLCRSRCSRFYSLFHLSVLAFLLLRLLRPRLVISHGFLDLGTERRSQIRKDE